MIVAKKVSISVTDQSGTHTVELDAGSWYSCSLDGGYGIIVIDPMRSSVSPTLQSFPAAHLEIKIKDNNLYFYTPSDDLATVLPVVFLEVKCDVPSAKILTYSVVVHRPNLVMKR